MGLVIENVSKTFITKQKKVHSLDNLNLDIKSGEFVCIVGPSGCGKTTLLNIIAGLETASKGRVLLNNKEIHSPGPDRTVIFQDLALFPWLKVIDNVEFGMKMMGVPKGIRREKALKYLKMVHLEKFSDSLVHQLSGGMKQRVAIARALALDSDILMMDEPFASLDSHTKNIMQLELQQIWIETKKTILFVTHNVEEAIFLADRVILLSSAPGVIKREVLIENSRPREIESNDLKRKKQILMNELQNGEYTDAKDNYRCYESSKKGFVLPDSDINMGIGF